MKPKNLKMKSWQAVLKNIGIPGLFILISLILILTSFACSISSKTTLTEKDNNVSVNLKSGDEFQVKLESNQTTGYSWALSEKTDSKIILIMSSEYETSSKDKNIEGAGGFEILTFKAANPGQTKLILEYVRPWEEGVEPTNIYILGIKVN